MRVYILFITVNRRIINLHITEKAAFYVHHSSFYIDILSKVSQCFCNVISRADAKTSGKFTWTGQKKHCSKSQYSPLASIFSSKVVHLESLTLKLASNVCQQIM